MHHVNPINRRCVVMQDHWKLQNSAEAVREVTRKSSLRLARIKEEFMKILLEGVTISNPSDVCWYSVPYPCSVIVERL